MSSFLASVLLNSLCIFRLIHSRGYLVFYVAGVDIEGGSFRLVGDTGSWDFMLTSRANPSLVNNLTCDSRKENVIEREEEVRKKRREFFYAQGMTLVYGDPPRDQRI